LAPEFFKGKGYTKAVDWWALGILLYEMMNGLPPFYSEDVEDMNSMIINSEVKFPYFFSKNSKEFLKKMLNKDPKNRLGSGVDDIEEVKRDLFFQKIDWKKLERKEIVPPFRPNLNGEMDVSYFDPDVTNERIASAIKKKIH